MRQKRTAIAHQRAKSQERRVKMKMTNRRSPKRRKSSPTKKPDKIDPSPVKKPVKTEETNGAEPQKEPVRVVLKKPGLKKEPAINGDVAPPMPMPEPTENGDSKFHKYYAKGYFDVSDTRPKE